MSDTAQVALTVVCYVVSVLAQLAGLALIVKEVQRTGRALARWRAIREEAGKADSSGQRGELGAVVDHVLGNQFDRTSAVVLLVIGVVVGALGNLLSL
ncbi:MAG: hypothetical protein M3Q47_06195 [Actinomycetota bacterium]|nr:hypothetical protein [Actinomycetota bacterium]